MNDLKFYEAATPFDAEFNSTNQSFAADFRGVSQLKGENGFSPVISVLPLEGGHKIVVTDMDGEHEFFVADGAPSTSKIGTVDLIAANWVGENSLYSQIVEIEGVTELSQVDLTPSVEQLVVFYEKDLTFVTENDGGEVTVYAIGQKPEHDYTIQVTITEVHR